MSLGRPSPLSSAHCSVLEGLKVVWLVSICHCNHGRFASFRKAFGLLLYPLVFLSRLQDTYPKARGSASIYFSSQGWSAHVFKKNLRPGNVSTALLHLAFLFSLLIVIFLKALNVVGLVPICRCKGGRFMSFRGAFGLVHFSFTLSSSEGCTCDRTSTCLSLQGW